MTWRKVSKTDWASTCGRWTVTLGRSVIRPYQLRRVADRARAETYKTAEAAMLAADARTQSITIGGNNDEA